MEKRKRGWLEKKKRTDKVREADRGKEKRVHDGKGEVKRRVVSGRRVGKKWGERVGTKKACRKGADRQARKNKIKNQKN